VLNLLHTLLLGNLLGLHLLAHDREGLLDLGDLLKHGRFGLLCVWLLLLLLVRHLTLFGVLLVKVLLVLLLK
jgi:hypothetical protein